MSLAQCTPIMTGKAPNSALPGSWRNTGAARSYFLKTEGTRACACATPPYPIDTTAHDRWLELMGNSLADIDEETIPPAYREMIWDHMQRVAAMMINKAP